MWICRNKDYDTNKPVDLCIRAGLVKPIRDEDGYSWHGNGDLGKWHLFKDCPFKELEFDCVKGELNIKTPYYLTFKKHKQYFYELSIDLNLEWGPDYFDFTYLQLETYPDTLTFYFDIQKSINIF